MQKVFSDSYKQRGPLNLFYVGDGPSIIRLECSDYFESLVKDSDNTIRAAKEDIIRPSGDAGYVSLLVLPLVPSAWKLERKLLPQQIKMSLLHQALLD
jgi:hypothetical protein